MTRLFIVTLLVAGSALAARSPIARYVESTHALTATGRAEPADTAFSAEVLALGEKIFKGKAAGGLCFSCHGANAKGMKKIAPDLTDATWIHGDGSYPFIVATVEQGIPKPKDAAAPMPPKGGANLTTDQVHAVAAYVWSLRNQK